MFKPWQMAAYCTIIWCSNYKALLISHSNPCKANFYLQITIFNKQYLFGNADSILIDCLLKSANYQNKSFTIIIAVRRYNWITSIRNQKWALNSLNMLLNSTKVNSKCIYKVLEQTCIKLLDQWLMQLFFCSLNTNIGKAVREKT